MEDSVVRRAADKSLVKTSMSWSYCGTFLICFALLAFEISTVRTISFAIGPSFIYIAIAIAMLGLTSAGSILCVTDLSAIKIPRERILFWCCIAIALLLVSSHFMVASTKFELNELVEEAGRSGGIGNIVRTLIVNGFPAAGKIGLFLCLPYFLFGGLLAYLFATTEGAVYGRLYAADLIGAAAGCVGAVVAMEMTDYALSVTVPAIVAALAASAYAMPLRLKSAFGGLVVAGALLMMTGMAWFEKAIEPASDPNYLVRDYEYQKDVFETWHRWNSYTRVGAVSSHDNQLPYTVLSLANGDGMAGLWHYDPNRAAPLVHKPAIPALLLDAPDDALVLFAGAGADLMSLHEHGAKRVVGVELNETLVDGGFALAEHGLEDFLANSSVNLEVAEGRVFLENDQSKYDLILISWSGATAAYYAGALGGTTQYLFTYEGLSSIFDHLKPNGYSIILQVNKVNVLAALRRYMDERGIDNPMRTAIVLFREDHVRAWDGTWDDNPLLINLDGWSDDQVARIVENAKHYNLKVAYAPGLPVHPEYQVYERILRTSNIDAELAALRSETDLRFDIVTDNRPFYLDLFLSNRYLTGDFWFGVSRQTLNAVEIYHLFRVGFVILISTLAIGLTLSPLFLLKGPTSKIKATTFLSYFFCLGSGFMFLEIGIMQRASLLFGNPGLTIAIVLGIIILFTGFGSLISNWSFRRGLSIRSTAALVAIYILILHLCLDQTMYVILTWPIVAKVAILGVFVAPGALLMGHLFPQGIVLAREEDPALVPWAWAINGAMSTIVAGFAPLVAQAWGFHSLFLIAGILYAAVLFIPLHRTNAVPQLAAAE